MDEYTHLFSWNGLNVLQKDQVFKKVWQQNISRLRSSLIKKCIDIFPLAFADINSMFPLEPLRKLVEEGLIAGIAPRHIGFMGGGGDLKKLVNETGPAIADILKKDGVYATVFTAG